MSRGGFSSTYILLIIVLLTGVLYLGKSTFFKTNFQAITITAPPRTETVDPYEFKGYCYVDECLIKYRGGSDVVGIARITGHYSPYETGHGYGSDAKVECEALAITDATPNFKKFVLDRASSYPIGGSLSEDGVFRLKISKKQTRSEDWPKIIRSNKEKPVTVSILIFPKGDMGYAACDSFIEIRYLL